jgi:hypothetical protein
MTIDTRLAAGTADVALLTIPALAVASWFSLPAPSTAIVASPIWRAGISAWTNYLQFAVFAVLMAAAFVAGYRRGRGITVVAARALSGDDRWPPQARAALRCAFAVVALAWAANASISSVTHPLTDDFHEGEYLGFVPHLRAGGSLAGALTTHGPGVDLLPAYASVALAGPDNGVAAARVAYALLRAAAVIAAIAGLAVLCRLLAPGDTRARWVVTTALATLALGAALRIGEWPDYPPLHKTLNARDAVYLAQIALVLAFARAMSRAPSAPRLAGFVAFAVGATLPWGPYYSYDRGLYGLAFVALVTVPFVAAPWRRAWIPGLLGGAAAGVTVMLVAVSRVDRSAALGQMRYWARYGRDMFSYPGIATPPEIWIPILFAGGTAALAWAVARAAQAFREHGSVLVQREPAAVVMLAASLPTLRMAIERGDWTHVAWAVTPAWMLASALLANVAATRLLWPRGDTAGRGEASAIGALLLSVLVGLATPLMNPAAAWKRIDREFIRGWRTADTSVLSSAHREVRSAMGAAVAASPCFVTLTNETTWYYVLDRPSCTRYFAVTNARASPAQEEFVGVLDAKRPQWILFESRAWSNALDGVSLFDGTPAIVAYVLSRYEPDADVAGNWFWRRAAEPSAWSDERIGEVRSHARTARRMQDARIDGVLRAGEAQPLPAALLVTAGDPPRPLWAGRPDAASWRAGLWSATLPTAALPAGTHRVQAWARRDAPARWIRLGEAVEVRIE